MFRGSGQSLTVLAGPNKHWLHQRSLTNTTTTEDLNISTDPPTSSSSVSSSSDSETTESGPASSSENAGSSSSIDSSTYADHATPGLPTSSSCAGDGDTPCEEDNDHGDENDNPEEGDNPENEEPENDEKPGDDEDSDDEDHETPDNDNGDHEAPDDDDEDDGDSEDDEAPDDEEPSDSSTHTSVITDEDGEVCTPLSEGEVVTVYSLIYTETLTWTDDPSDYIAPYPTMDIPTYCEPTTPSTTSPPSTKSTPQLTSISGSDDGWNTYCSKQPNGTSSCISEPIFNPSFILTSRPIELTSPLIAPPADRLTSTFFITSKNPSVVYPPDSTPDYGQNGDDDDSPGNPGNGNFPAETRPPSGPRPPQSAVNPNPPQVTITADPTQVVIGDYTLSNLKPGATTRITVGGNEYEINPSQIVQSGGKTINRPGAGQALAVANPIKTAINGVAINVSGSQVVIGGYTYTIGSTPSTEVVQGHTVVISPTGVEFKGTDQGVSFEANPPEQTGIIVAGGEMMTAIGNSVIVIHEKTITYGPGISPRTETVDDDTIVIDEHGVVVHGTTVGGDSLAGDKTRYDVVGGATLTRVGPSKIVIRDVTYTVGPGTGTTTTFVGGEDITIAPDGVTVATLTVPYPFGATVVTAIPAPKTTDPSPQETANDDDEDDDEDGAGALGPGWAGVCIAIGAWLLL